MGKGVSTCATCDGALFNGKKVVVVGGGDFAMEESTFLAKFAAEVYVVHRGVRLYNQQKDETTEMEIDGLFLAIGHEPNTAFLRDHLDMDERGYIRCERDCCRTSVEGVYACGDVMDPKYRQVATSVGTGCRAAMDCETFLGR